MAQMSQRRESTLLYRSELNSAVWLRPPFVVAPLAAAAAASIHWTCGLTTSADCHCRLPSMRCLSHGISLFARSAALCFLPSPQ
jgi:hypothetical protein